MLPALLLLAVAAPAGAEPLVFDHGRLFLTAEINGVQTEALLDSAAEATLVDPALAAAAKLPEGTPQKIRGSGGEAQARIVEGTTVEALGVELHPEAIVVLDLAELSTRLIKRPTRMVLGRELFDAARLQVDIQHRDVRTVGKNVSPPGKRLQLKTEHGVESMPVLVNGRSAHAEVDLGNGSDVLISRALAKALGLKTTGRKVGGGIGGQVNREMVTLQRLAVAGRTFRDVPAAIDDQPTASELNIGTSILKDFLITTDFQQHNIWLARP